MKPFKFIKFKVPSTTDDSTIIISFSTGLTHCVFADRAEIEIPKAVFTALQEASFDITKMSNKDCITLAQWGWRVVKIRGIERDKVHRPQQEKKLTAWQSLASQESQRINAWVEEFRTSSWAEELVRVVKLNS